jgi:hypothetical protein
LTGSVVGEGHANSSKESVEYPHEGVIDIWRVLLAGLEFKGSIVPSEIAGQTDKHFSKRWVNIEIELALQIVRAEFSETSKSQAIRIIHGKCGALTY